MDYLALIAKAGLGLGVTGLLIQTGVVDYDKMFNNKNTANSVKNEKYKFINNSKRNNIYENKKYIFEFDK